MNNLKDQFYGVNGKRKNELKSEEDVKKILNQIKSDEFTSYNRYKKRKKTKSSCSIYYFFLQQEAARKLNFRAKKTMMLAQQLYEGIDLGKEGTVGLITYMRTDSTTNFRYC